tara:strand:- start:312 stop:920 length:609 start_codon:yes stop_codon:yes gene_type:complete
MNLKITFQILLLVTILTIISIFLYSFFIVNENKVSEIENDIKNNNLNLDTKISNELINIEYNSTDDDGNTYYLNAQKGIVEENEQIDNKIRLEGVIAVINLKNKGIINIYSKNAYYDKINHNTKFYEDVKIDYLDYSIFSENLDILFTEKISNIYNNVTVTNNTSNLKSDKIFIDLISGDIKLQMDNNLEKIKLVTNYEFIN